MSTAHEVLTEMQLQKLKIPELKALCRQRSLAVSGNKAALIARLLLASATVSSLAPKAAATSPASPSLAIPDHPSNSYPAAIAKNTSSAPTLPPAIPDSLPIAVHSRARHAEISVAASTSLSYSALLPSKRTFTESTSSVSASARPTESVKLLTKIAPATASSALSLKQFQVLRPAMPTVPESSSSPAHATSSPLISARPSFTLRDLAGQYVWLLPLLGQTSFQSFLPKNMTPGCLQAVTAYLLTRVYCLLGQYETDSISAVSSQTTPRVENVTPLHSGVYQCSFGDDSKHTFVGATGEIISSDDNIRPDWSTFLATKDNTQDQFDLISLVRNQDDESFERGIGKAFRKRLSEMKDRDMASELLAVAESYVLAHVAPNAISGAWQSVHHQCADFQGMSQNGGGWSRAKQSIGFFLPEAHLVESVSLAGLHGCLAVIQTTHRLHFVFRLTGQIVGEGDEGVFPLFQELLGCDAVGHARKI